MNNQTPQDSPPTASPEELEQRLRELARFMGSLFSAIRSRRGKSSIDFAARIEAMLDRPLDVETKIEGFTEGMDIFVGTTLDWDAELVQGIDADLKAQGLPTLSEVQDQNRFRYRFRPSAALTPDTDIETADHPDEARVDWRYNT